jgi:peptidyl-prolyl cis-trans isomerase C
MKHAATSALLIAGLMLAAPVTAQQGQAQPGDGTLLATVNGQPYELDTFRAFFSERVQQTGGQNTPELQQQAFNEFLNLVVASQEADKRDLGDLPEVQSALEMQRMMVLSAAALQQIAAESDPSEKELEAAYDDLVEQEKRTEYKARHILVDEKAQAEDLIKKLDKSKGKDFEKLARESSLGPTAEKGGDLGWFDARRMVKPFSDAVASMEPGTYTKQPVQTQFGWHVILLEETRAAEPPSFDAAKPRLEATVRRQKVADKLNELRAAADVKLNEDVVKVREEPAGD